MKSLVAITISMLMQNQVFASQCTSQTEEFEHMHEQYIELRDDSGDTILLKVKVADESTEQAAGYQHICPDVIDTTAILFVFNQAKKPSFHMNNVFADLDIAFIGTDGRIGDIQRMSEEKSTGLRKLYPSEVETKYALEVAAGYFSENNISTENSWLRIDD